MAPAMFGKAMAVRAVLPPFLPVEEIRQRVLPVLPDLDIVEEPLDPGKFPLDQIDVLILTTFTLLPGDVIERLPALKFIQVASTGYDAVDLAACRSRGIRVANVPVANSASVAEHVILSALILLRRAHQLDSQIRKGEWPLLTDAHDLGGKVFGIVGMGRIGRALATRLLPFETSTIYYDTVRPSPEEERRLGLTYVDLPTLFESADIVSLHVPLVPATQGMVNASLLSRMKPGAILVNTARAEVVDLGAVRPLVAEGKIHLALDVYPEEPPDFSDSLFQAPGTFYTPHVAGATREAQERFVAETVKNVLRFLQGKDPLYRVDHLPDPQ